MSYFRALLLCLFVQNFDFLDFFYIEVSFHTKKLLDIKVNLKTKFGKSKIVCFLRLAVLVTYFDSHSEGCLSETPSFSLLGQNAMQQAFI